MVRVKSGANIRVQVESIKRRKTEGGESKRRLPNNNNGKENSDPMTISVRKKRKSGKKDHNLSKHSCNEKSAQLMVFIKKYSAFI